MRLLGLGMLGNEIKPTDDPARIAEYVIPHWSDLKQLASFAVKGHGWGDSNGGFGVTYPGDLDDYEIHVEKIVIGAGEVLLTCFWGPPDGFEVLTSEQTYLSALEAALLIAGHDREAAQVSQLIRDLNERNLG